MYTLQKNYHCDCGKLLFRGLLISNAVEIKCKRCGSLKIFNGFLDHRLAPNQFALIINKDGNIKKVSQRAPKFTGYSLDKLLSMNAHGNLFPHLLSEKACKFIWDYNGILRAEGPIRRKDGSEFQVMGVNYLILIDGEHYKLSIFTDYGVNGIPDNIDQLIPVSDFCFEVDINGCCNYVDAGVYGALGYAQEDLWGTQVLFGSKKAVKETKIPESDIPFKQLFSNNTSFKIKERTLYHKDGRPFVFESIFFPLVSDLGKIMGYRSFNWKK